MAEAGARPAGNIFAAARDIRTEGRPWNQTVPCRAGRCCSPRSVSAAVWHAITAAAVDSAQVKTASSAPMSKLVSVNLVEFDAKGAKKGAVTADKVVKSDAEWMGQL